MATRKNKYAGRCVICRKYITWDDHDVVVDLTAVAIRPAWELSGDHTETLEEMVTELLRLNPLCSTCWHETNKVHDLAKGAMTVVRANAVVDPRAEFVWTKVR
jgi:hypothetical protein